MDNDFSINRTDADSGTHLVVSAGPKGFILLDRDRLPAHIRETDFDQILVKGIHRPKKSFQVLAEVF